MEAVLNLVGADSRFYIDLAAAREAESARYPDAPVGLTEAPDIKLDVLMEPPTNTPGGVGTAGLAVRGQAYVQDIIRPGQWCCRKHLRRAHATWTIRRASPMRVLRKFRDYCSETEGVELARYNEQTMHARGLHFTGAGWVDAVDIQVTNTAGSVTAEIWSVSTGFCCNTMPGAPLLSILFSWFPFDDWQQNLKHINDAREFLERGTGDSIELQQQVHEKGGRGKLARDAATEGTPESKDDTTLVKDLPPPPGFDSVPLYCFLCGLCIATGWMAATVGVNSFVSSFGNGVFMDMQVCFAVAFFVVIMIQAAMDDPLEAGRTAYFIYVVLGLVVNGVVLLCLDIFNDSLTQGLVMGLSAVLGLGTALAGGSFVLFLPRLQLRASVAFRTGFSASVLAAMMMRLGATATSSGVPVVKDHYFVAAGVVTLVGIVPAVLLVLNHRVAPLLNKAFPRGSILTRKSGILKDTLPSVMALTVSTAAASLAFAWAPAVPSRGGSLTMALVLILIFGSAFGQKVVDWVDVGVFPSIVATQGGLLTLAVCRVLCLIPYFLYSVNATSMTADNVGLCFGAAVFAVSTGYVSSSAWLMASRAVPLFDREKVASYCFVAVQIGIVLGFGMAEVLRATGVGSM